MGIRVHKVLGYGLTNVGKGTFKKKGEKYQINDTRFSEQSIINGDYEDREDKYSNQGFLEFLEKKPKEKTMIDIHWLKESMKKKESTHSVQDCFVHQAEYGLPNVVVIVPYMEIEQWTRYDSMMDYCQECYIGKKKGCVNRVDIIDEALYPWLGHIDGRTGRDIKDSLSFAVRRVINSKAPYETEPMDQLSKTLGFDSFDDLMKNMKPMVPEVVQWQCEYGNVFTDPNVVYQLQPMIYTYWS